MSGASTIAFAAIADHNGGWSVSSLPSNVASSPAIVAFDSGFLAVFVDADGLLEDVAFSWSWSSPSQVGGARALGAPSAAVAGSSLHLVYQEDDGKYVHGVYTSDAGWGSVDDPVGGATKQGFGPSPPVATAEGSTLAIAYGGQNGLLYDETWSSAAWEPDTEHTAAQVGALSPAIVALSGGSGDTLVVYAAPGGTLYFTSRAAGAWSAPAVVNSNAFTNAAPSLVGLPGGGAMLAYLGTNGLPYFSVYDPSEPPLWSSPAPIGTGKSTLASPPTVAPGVCGDEVVTVLSQPEGVAVVRYAGGAWLPATLLEGTAGMTFASVASHP
jgi:hypothetical protein